MKSSSRSRSDCIPCQKPTGLRMTTFVFLCHTEARNTGMMGNHLHPQATKHLPRNGDRASRGKRRPDASSAVARARRPRHSLLCAVSLC